MRPHNCFLIHLLFNLYFFVRSESPVVCSSDSESCKIHEDNLLESVGNVGNIDECRQLCYDNKECGYITYYGAASFPLSEFCLLFSSCESTIPCTNCTSETKTCYKACGEPFLGELSGDNVLKMEPDTESESECQHLCINHANCTYYTYFLETDPSFPQLCVLLSSLEKPFQDCDTCLTGRTDCQVYSPCSLEVNGQILTSYMFDRTDLDNKMKVIGDGDNCTMRILVVGGGGSGDFHQNESYYYSGGGGGSGYLYYTILPSFPWSIMDFTVTVGSFGEPSVVKFLNGPYDGMYFIDADPGQNGYHNGSDNGGDGYCGGGAGCCNQHGSMPYCGGSDGSDGENDVADGDGGGHGTGEDIKEYKFDNFELSPGKGGCWGIEAGGGGGGVLVNGQGPEELNPGQGEGYGGGGNGVDLADGHQGVILVELVGHQ